MENPTVDGSQVPDVISNTALLNIDKFGITIHSKAIHDITESNNKLKQITQSLEPYVDCVQRELDNDANNTKDVQLLRTEMDDTISNIGDAIEVIDEAYDNIESSTKSIVRYLRVVLRRIQDIKNNSRSTTNQNALDKINNAYRDINDMISRFGDVYVSVN